MGCFLVRSECEGCLTLREMLDWPSYQADLGAVYVCVTTRHGLLIQRASPRPHYVGSGPHTQAPYRHTRSPSPLFTHTRTPLLLTSHTSCTYSTCKPPIPCHMHTHTACLVARPAAPTRPAALLYLSLVTDERVRSISSRLGSHFQGGCKTIQGATR